MLSSNSRFKTIKDFSLRRSEISNLLESYRNNVCTKYEKPTLRITASILMNLKILKLLVLRVYTNGIISKPSI